MKTPLCSQRGFTLIEIMLAMILIGTTGVSTLSAFSNASRVTQSPENSAYYVGSKILAVRNEAVRADWWAQPNLQQPLSFTNPTTLNPTTETIGNWTYSPIYTVNNGTGQAFPDGNGDGFEDYRKVSVRVSWP